MSFMNINRMNITHDFNPVEGGDEERERNLAYIILT